MSDTKEERDIPSASHYLRQSWTMHGKDSTIGNRIFKKEMLFRTSLCFLPDFLLNNGYAGRVSFAALKAFMHLASLPSTLRSIQFLSIRPFSCAGGLEGAPSFISVSPFWQ